MLMVAREFYLLSKIHDEKRPFEVREEDKTRNKTRNAQQKQS
jgi:hypothetical protein